MFFFVVVARFLIMIRVPINVFLNLPDFHWAKNPWGVSSRIMSVDPFCLPYSESPVDVFSVSSDPCVRCVGFYPVVLREPHTAPFSGTA